MKNVGVVVALLSLLFACQDPAVKSLTATGSIQGKALYTGVNDHSGIVITAESVDSTGKALGSLAGQTTTDSTGSYSLEDLPNGTYTVYASSASSLEKAVSIGVTVSEARSISVADLQLTATGSISGVATLGGQTSGNLGIVVYVAGTSYLAMTRDDGVFTISGVPVATNYLVVASFDGYNDSTPATVDVEAGKTTNLTSISLSVTASVATVGSVSGTATLSGKAPGQLAGTFVYLTGSSALAMTDANGAFSMANVPVGTYTLYAEKTGYDSASVGVVVSAGANTAVGTVALTLPAPPSPGSKAISAFTLSTVVTTSSIIDQTAHTIRVIVEPAADLTTLVPQITYSGVDISPPNLWQQDFTNPVIYTVTASDGSTQDYQVTIRKPKVFYQGEGATIGAIPSVQSVNGPTSTVVTLPVPPLRTGYFFAGWSTGPNNTGSVFTGSSPVTGDTIVYANWAPSGSVWTARTMPSSANWTSVAYGNGLFVAVASGSATAATSPDGTTWTARSLPTSSGWSSITFGNGLFVAVSNNSGSAATSPDGINWTSRALPPMEYWRLVTFGGGVFVAVAPIANVVATSPDGITWTIRALPASGNSYSVVHGNGIFVAVGNGSSTAATSLDGVAWTAQTLPSSSSWASVAFGNGLFAAVATGGSTAATSPDGVTWTTRSLPSAGSWAAVAFGNGVFVSLANGSGSAAVSLDGLTWTSRALPKTAAWMSVAHGSSIFVAVATGSQAASSF